jgi:DNA mismatch repair protein MutS
VEFLHNSPFAPKTLFATHYHELNELEDKLPQVKNYHVTNKEIANKIIFLRKLARGGSTHSFGIHVAKMAGMPPKLIERANDILKQLEAKHVDDEEEGLTVDRIPSTDGDGSTVIGQRSAVNIANTRKAAKTITAPQIQLSIFDAHSQTFNEIRQILAAIDINRLTPVEALLKLQEVKEKVK